MTKKYYAITKQTTQGMDLYLTAKLIKNIPSVMFTGNINLAYAFESENEANEFFLNYPWSEVPIVEIKAI